MKAFPGRSVEEITELAVELANACRNSKTGIINKADILNYAWHLAADAFTLIQEAGDDKVGRHYSLSTVANCAEKIAEQIANTGMVDIG